MKFFATPVLQRNNTAPQTATPRGRSSRAPSSQRSLGYKRVIARSDVEPAILALLKVFSTAMLDVEIVTDWPKLRFEK